MPTFTETKVLQSLEIFPALNVINVKHLATTLKDGVKLIEQTEAKSYSTSQFSDFKIEVAPTGGTLAEIVAGFSAAALDAAAELPPAIAAHTLAIAAKDAEVAAATSAHESAIAAMESTHASTLAAKDATIATLQAQIEAAAAAALEKEAAVAAAAAAEKEAAAAAAADVPPISAQQAQSLVLALGPTLGLTAGQLEVLFAEAEKLQTP